MTKKELAAKIAAATKTTQTTAAMNVDAVLDAIKEELAAGNTLSLIGFGTFSVGERAARTGRNPQTGKKLKIAAKKVVKFKPGKALKEGVNN